MQLIITEKPSVAQSIAKVLGDYNRKDGYLENRESIITWCVGHLVGLSFPEAYGIDTWSLDTLPIVPSTWKYEVLEATKKQFQIVEKLMNDARIDLVVCATDAGREGELIFRLVYEKAKCNKPCLRLWLMSMEEEAIKTSMASLQESQHYDKLYDSALCRAKADWLVGMNATRLFTVLCNKKLPIGRVQTPTLAMLVEREKQIASFQSKTSYCVEATIDGYIATSPVLESREEAQTLLKTCEESQVLVVSMNEQEQRKYASLPYDLTTLQREANRFYGYTAQESMQTAQTLYEKKLLTYPRTDSRYLLQEMESSTFHIIELARQKLNYKPFEINLKRLMNNQKVGDHHALLPTLQGLEQDLDQLSNEERNLLCMVIKQLVLASAPAHLSKTQEAHLICNNTAFVIKGNQVIEEGFCAFQEVQEEEKPLPKWIAGQTLFVSSWGISQHESTAPKHYNEDRLLGAMERDKKNCLGTASTRGGYIEKLLQNGYAIRKGKHLLPSEAGEKLIGILPSELCSASLTGSWEERLQNIETGDEKAEQFLEDIESFIEQLITKYSSLENEKQLFESEKTSLGDCPKCGKMVYEIPKGFVCENRDCDFAIWKNDLFFKSKKKSLTASNVKSLLSKGNVKMKNLYSAKTDKTYDATITLEDTSGKYARFGLIFEPKKE